MPPARRIVISFAIAGRCLLSLSAAPESSGTPPQTLVDWKVHYFSADELRDGTSDDGTVLGFDANPNLLRYALGFGPRESMPTLLAIRSAGDQLEVITPQAIDRPDVACQLEISLDLKSWSIPIFDLADNEATQSAPTTEPAGTFLADSPRYFRLTVERITEDSDEDGLPDDHELAWFASITHHPTDDPDDDGVTTAEELLLGRSPHRGVLADSALAAAATGLEIFTPLE